MAVSVNRAVVGGSPFSYTRTPYTPQVVGSTIETVLAVVEAHWWRQDDIHMGLNGWVMFQGSTATTAAFAISLPTVDGIQVQINSSLLLPEVKTLQTMATLLGNADMSRPSAGYIDIVPSYHGTSTFQFNNRTGLVTARDVGSSAILRWLVLCPIYEWSRR